MSDYVYIFDTTLRDGEQSPGCSMNVQEKLQVARMLDELGVDVIEAGFPAASEGDFESVKSVGELGLNATICGLSRTRRGDIEAVAKSLETAQRKRLHVFIATSPIHREYKLEMSKAEVVERAVAGVTKARSLCEDVEFSAEDAARTEPEFLAEVVTAVIAAGARTVNIPDTVGYAVPGEFGELIRYLRDNVPNIDQATLSVHCHDDLGLAVANSLAAVEAGARQIECTINGIGERAGNCALEEVVMAVRTRTDQLPVATAVDTRRLHPTSRLVASVTGVQVPRNKAIVGENAFAHEAGIHQHGMMRHESTYEIMRPEDVGLGGSRMVLGKHSGRHAFRRRVEELGFELDEADLDRAFMAFKQLADRKKDVYDADIEALVLRTDVADVGPWRIVEMHITSGSGSLAAAALRMAHQDGRTRREAAAGDGPVEAAFSAIQRATGIEVALRDFDIRNVTTGKDAQGEAIVHVDHYGTTYRGTGLDTDIVEASALAFLQAINRICRAGGRPVPSEHVAPDLPATGSM